MGSLVNATLGTRIYLEAVHSIGRSERSTLRLSDPRVSLEHASIRWDGEGWILRDLAALNHTLVDGIALPVGGARVLKEGARISFGADELSWLLDSSAAPRVMAVPVADGSTVVEEGGLLALPSSDNPLLTIYRNEDGAWQLDPPPSSAAEVVDQSIIQVGVAQYRVCVPQATKRTTPVQGLHGARVADLNIVFRVSSDLDDVELLVSCGPAEKRLSARSHFELLRVLARARREDTAEGLPEPNCGWLHMEELLRRVRLDVEHLNVQIFRIRSQFATLGLLDPACIVERRSRSRYLRFGVPRSSEAPL